MAYLKKMKAKLDITYLEKEDIPINCPYGSSLDFLGFGYLKQEISKRQPRTLEGIWKIAQEVWSSIDLRSKGHSLIGSDVCIKYQLCTANILNRLNIFTLSF